MPRVKNSVATRARRKKVLKLAKGYFGSKHLLYRTAHEQVMNSLAYAYRDRRQVKRDMRRLWIARINAAARMNEISYSVLMHGLKLANVNVNRKMLSEMAIHDAKGFTAIVDLAKKALKKVK
jgi:large subunit ribosomal protein L20